jgi:hypothetical protein
MGLPTFSHITNTTRFDFKHIEKANSSMLSSQIILKGLSLVFSVMTLVITVLQPVFVMAALWNDRSWFVRRLLKSFNEKSFLHDLASVNWYRISLISSVEDAWTLFLEIFSHIVNKHTMKKNRFNPWFDRDLAELLQLKSCIWRKAWHTHPGWLPLVQANEKVYSGYTEGQS